MRLALRAIGVGLSISLCGCSFSPPQPNDAVHEPKIMRGVLTELYCAVRFLRQRDTQDPRMPLTPMSAQSDVYKADFLPFDEYWVALIDVGLKTDLEGMALPEVTLISPVNPGAQLLPGRTPGSYNVAAGASYDNTATTNRDSKAYVDINLLMQHWAPPTIEQARKNPNQYILSEPVDCTRPSEGTYLEGPLGIKPWLQRAVQSYQFARFIAPDASEASTAALRTTINPVDPANPSSWSIPFALAPVAPGTKNPAAPKNVPTLGATFTFIIKGSAHVGPSVTLDHTKGGSSSLLSVTRTETNDVNVALTPSAPEPTLVLTTVPGRAPGHGLFRFQQPGPTVVTTVQQSRVQSLNDALSRLDAEIINLQLSALPRM
jgi:hypothetical protein